MFFSKIPILSNCIRFILHSISRWKILTAYILFSTLALSGWYVDIIGAFSSQQDYATVFRAQHGDINKYNILAFLIGTIFYLFLMLYDYKKLRLDKNAGADNNFKNVSLTGEAQQAISQGGVNSPALNAQNVNITYNGVTEERCRAIFDEKWEIAMRDFTFESIATVEKRQKEFRSQLLPRIKQEDKDFKSFADPAFQFLLMDAQKSAATSERDADYQVLTELLAQRVKEGYDRKKQIHIKKAVEILPYVSDEALLGLTTSLVLLTIVPLAGDVKYGLKVLNDTLSHIINDDELPKGRGWVDVLEACGLVKTSFSSIEKLNKANLILRANLEGYALPGIKKDSANYQKALELLQNSNLPSNLLVDNIFNVEYVRLNLSSESNIDKMASELKINQGISIKLYYNEDQKKRLHEIYSLYEADKLIKDKISELFDVEVKNYPVLKQVCEWWDQIDAVFQLTATGKILANANANRCDSNIPILESKQ